jgi:hypothetical protein
MTSVWPRRLDRRLQVPHISCPWVVATRLSSGLMILWTQQFFQNVQEGGRVAGANSVQSEYGATVFVCLGGWAIHSLGNKKVRTHRKPLCVCVFVCVCPARIGAKRLKVPALSYFTLGSLSWAVSDLVDLISWAFKYRISWPWVVAAHEASFWPYDI